MKSVRDSVHDIIAERILPWIERDGIINLILPEQITPADCARPIECEHPCNRHPQHELGIGLAGEAVYGIDHKRFIFTPGRIVLMPGMVPHGQAQATRWRTDSVDLDQPSILWMSPYPFGLHVMLSHIMAEEDVAEVTRPYMLLDRRFSRLVDSLLEEARSRPPYSNDIGRAILIEFMHRCLRATAVTPAESLGASVRQASRSKGRGSANGRRAKRTKSDSRKIPERVLVAQEFIHSNYHRPIGLDDIADATDSSIAHLSRQFRNATGLPPIEYLTDVRMKAARELLETDLKIYNIAHMVGITDPSYFTRLFHRIHGVNPIQYRRKTIKMPRPLPAAKTRIAK